MLELTFKTTRNKGLVKKRIYKTTADSIRTGINHFLRDNLNSDVEAIFLDIDMYLRIENNYVYKRHADSQLRHMKINCYQKGCFKRKTISVDIRKVR